MKVIVCFALVWLMVSFGEAGVKEPVFLRPPAYTPFFQDLVEYGGLEVMDLSGGWRISHENSGARNTVQLPASWENYRGKITFRRNFRLEDSYEGKSVRLVILGLSRRCSVILNENSLGEFEGPIVDFILPRRAVHYRSINVLEIEVDNKLHPRKTIPLRSGSLKPDNYGGITDDIFLIIEDFPHINELQVNSTVSKGGEAGSVIVDLSVASFPAQKLSGRAVCKLVDSAGKVAARSAQEIADSDSMRLRMDFSKPRLWSLEEPYLYTVEVWLETEEGKSCVHRRRVGFRDFQAGETFKLNGVELKILGVTYWAEQEYGFTFKPEDYLRDVMMIRRCGANAILLPEPGHPYLLSLCDSLGVLVFQSTSLDGVPKAVFRSRGFYEKADGHLARMIGRRSYHPSVTGWVLGRGLADDFPVDRLTEIVQVQDSRLIFWEQGGGYERRLRLVNNNERVEDLLVVSALDAQVFDDGEDVEQRQFAKFNLLLQKWKHADGVFFGTFADYKANREILFQGDIRERRIFRGGLVSRDRRGKFIFNQLEGGWFNLQSSEYVPSSDLQPLAFPITAIALLAVFIISVRNNKVFRKQFKRVFAHSHGFFVDVRNNRFIQPSQTMFVSLTSALVLSLIFSTLINHYRRSLALDYILGHCLGGGVLHSAALSAIWNPIKLMIYLFVIFIFLFFAGAVMFKTASFLMHRRFSFGRSIVFASWSGANFVWLGPLPLFFYRGLSMEFVRQLELSLLIFFICWGYFRIVKALRVACGCGFFKALFIFSLLNLTALGFVLVYLQYGCGLLYYWGYLWGVVL